MLLQVYCVVRPPTLPYSRLHGKRKKYFLSGRLTVLKVMVDYRSISVVRSPGKCLGAHSSVPHVLWKYSTGWCSYRGAVVLLCVGGRVHGHRQRANTCSVHHGLVLVCAAFTVASSRVVDSSRPLRCPVTTEPSSWRLHTVDRWSPVTLPVSLTHLTVSHILMFFPDL